MFQLVCLFLDYTDRGERMFLYNIESYIYQSTSLNISDKQESPLTTQ